MKGMRTCSALKGRVKIVTCTTLLIIFYCKPRNFAKLWLMDIWQNGNSHTDCQLMPLASLADRANSKILLAN